MTEIDDINAHTLRTQYYATCLPHAASPHLTTAYEGQNSLKLTCDKI